MKIELTNALSDLNKTRKKNQILEAEVIQKQKEIDETLAEINMIRNENEWQKEQMKDFDKATKEVSFLRLQIEEAEKIDKILTSKLKETILKYEV